MNCDNCKVEIPPSWARVIQENKCPNCLGEIMSPATKELLSELSQAMTKMPNDPEGLAGWLLSNYKLQKIGSVAPVVQFHRGQVNKSAPAVNNIQEQEKANKFEEFLARSGMKKPVVKNPTRQEHLKKVASQINRQQDYVEVEDEGYDSHYYEGEEYETGEELSPEAEYMSAQMSTELSKAATNDIVNEPPALQRTRLQKLARQEAMSSGGVGLISRK